MRLIEDILERVLEEMPHLQADIDDSCGFCTEEFVGVFYGIYFALLIRLPRARTAG